jgi:hypothetical protein
MATSSSKTEVLVGKVVAGRPDDEVTALVGNFLPLKPPPLSEFVRHCLIVEKESGALIPFDLWPAQEEALAVIERRIS